MSATSSLTRKLGPAPVWVWALVGAFAVWFLFLRSPSSGAQTTQAPVTGSTAGVPDTGAVGSTDANGNAGDLLAQLLQGQQDVIDKLTGAFVGGGQGATGSSGAATSSTSSGVAPSSVSTDGSASSPSDAAPAAPVETTTTPTDTNVGTVDVAGTPYTGYTQTPSSTISTGIVPAIDYVVGQGAPVLETLADPRISTPAYATSDVGVSNASIYASHTGDAVAA